MEGNIRRPPGVVCDTEEVTTAATVAAVRRGSMARPVWEEDVAWQDRGLCRNMDPEIWFSTDDETREDRVSREIRAKAICEICPVLRQCRDFALTTKEPYGVWGGLTEGERRRILEREAG